MVRLHPPSPHRWRPCAPRHPGTAGAGGTCCPGGPARHKTPQRRRLKSGRAGRRHPPMTGTCHVCSLPGPSGTCWAAEVSPLSSWRRTGAKRRRNLSFMTEETCTSQRVHEVSTLVGDYVHVSSYRCSRRYNGLSMAESTVLHQAPLASAPLSGRLRRATSVRAGPGHAPGRAGGRALRRRARCWLAVLSPRLSRLQGDRPRPRTLYMPSIKRMSMNSCVPRSPLPKTETVCGAAPAFAAASLPRGRSLGSSPPPPPPPPGGASM